MRKLKQYSKCIIKSMIILWFIGAAFGGAIVVVELVNSFISQSYGTTVHLPELLNYIGMPVSGGIVGYLLKSAFENKEKIKQNPNYDEYTGGYEN